MPPRRLRVPEDLSFKYHGCGNGVVWLDKHGEVLDFDYTDEDLEIITEQNILMHNDAGKLIKQNKNGTSCYRANFSCYEICLF